jgi:CheY-like chemotaxis protein
MKEMLIGWRMLPTLAANATEALVALRAAEKSGKPLPLVLTDFQMPDVDGFTLAEMIKNDPSTAHATVIMLTSAGLPGDAARCRQVGIAAYLPKPIKRSELRRAIVLALSVRSGDPDPPPLITRHVLAEINQRARILLVEDNRVNQLIARRLLEKHGHTVVVADNGRQAFTILEKAGFVGFDCVLMDLQMPEMDGFECTAAIRERELVTRSHLPIIAMTAHAMTGDESRCLAAGMDAYLSKPIQPDAFFDVIEGHLRNSGVPVAHPTWSPRKA